MVRSSLIVTLISVASVTITPAAAAPPKASATTKKVPVRKKPPEVVDVPALPPEPVMTRTADGLMTPNAVRLRPTTPIEEEANAVWSVRAALNIAALQCQFSPFLATVRNYNQALQQHADELDKARGTMVSHFRRYDKAGAQTSFDRYTTQTYNSFSTLDAQYAFCETAARVGREVLTLRKGGLGKIAPTLRDEVRLALVPIPAFALLKPFEITPEPVPAF